MSGSVSGSGSSTSTGASVRSFLNTSKGITASIRMSMSISFLVGTFRTIVVIVVVVVEYPLRLGGPETASSRRAFLARKNRSDLNHSSVVFCRSIRHD